MKSTAALRLVTALTFLACSALGQMVYNVSVYCDSSTDGVTLFATSTTVDNSTGCSAHGYYSTTVTLIAPNGTQAPGTAAGMVANTSMPIAGRLGNFTATGTAVLYCGCFAHWVGAGGPAVIINVANTQTGYQWPVLKGGGKVWVCSYSRTSCYSGTPSCTGGSWGSLSQPTPPCPDIILVEYLRVSILGVQACFVTGWDDVTLSGPPTCN